MVNLTYITSNGWVVTQLYSSKGYTVLILLKFTQSDISQSRTFRINAPHLWNMIFDMIVNNDVLHLVRPVGITNFVGISAHLLTVTQMCSIRDVQVKLW